MKLLTTGICNVTTVEHAQKIAPPRQEKRYITKKVSVTMIQQKTCAQCTGYDRTKTGCYFKPYDHFWGIAAIAQVQPTDTACHLFKTVELPVLSGI